MQAWTPSQWNQQKGTQKAKLFLAFFLQTLPNLVHNARFGASPNIGNRKYREGDLYALRLSQMLLPVPGHRIPELADLRARYTADAPFINENEAATLGIVGSVGLLCLLFRGVFARALQRGQFPSSKQLDALAVLLLAGLLLGTFGGFGPTLNYFGFTTIRSYNRISIFLALFSLLAVGILIDRFVAVSLHGKRGYSLLICSSILCFGLLDEISPAVVPSYQQNARDFASDAKFVASIESALPPGASIYQLPLMDYPESNAIHDLTDYQLFRGYLHSSTLHWSYRAMKGRQASQWQRQVIRLPLPVSIAQIRDAGFSGIYLDRRAYPTLKTEAALGSVLGPPIVSEDGRLVFFNLLRPPPH